jgi:hypothetical protein
MLSFARIVVELSGGQLGRVSDVLERAGLITLHEHLPSFLEMPAESHDPKVCQDQDRRTENEGGTYPRPFGDETEKDRTAELCQAIGGNSHAKGKAALTAQYLLSYCDHTQRLSDSPTDPNGNCSES